MSDITMTNAEKPLFCVQVPISYRGKQLPLPSHPGHREQQHGLSSTDVARLLVSLCDGLWRGFSRSAYHCSRLPECGENHRVRGTLSNVIKIYINYHTLYPG